MPLVGALLNSISWGAIGFFSGYSIYWLTTTEYPWYGFVVGAVLGFSAYFAPRNWMSYFTYFLIPIAFTSACGIVTVWFQIVLEKHIEWLGPLSTVIGLAISFFVLRHLDSGDRSRR